MRHYHFTQTIKKVGLVILAGLLAFSNGICAAGAATYEEARPVLSAENTSFVSFPARFQDWMPEGYDEVYYIFSIENRVDLSISVTYEDSSNPYGAELLDSSMSRLGSSHRRAGQRIVEKQVPAGTYFLRVYAMKDEREPQPFTISIQKMDLSKSAVRATDFSELHMVAALQGTDSPYQLNGTSPDYTYSYGEGDGVTPIYWEKLATPSNSGKGVSEGGVYPMPQSYYASWLGPVEEDVLSMEDIRPLKENETFEEYDQYLQDEGIVYKREHAPLLHVQNGIALPPRYLYIDRYGMDEENPGWEEHLKNAVMTYGGVTTGILWSNLSCEDPENYYYSGWNLFVGSKNDPSAVILANEFDWGFNPQQNHEVVIVGWDDNYSRENFRYAIGDDVILRVPDTASTSNARKTAWLEENVYASGDKMYAGYYTARLDKTILLEPGEPFEIILRLENDESEELKIPMVMNNRLIANIPSKEGVSFLYDPAEGESWIDMGTGFEADNGSSNYYCYFSMKALCQDPSLEEGETKRISVLDIKPDKYFSLKEGGIDGDQETGERESEEQETEQVLDGHILQTRTGDSPIEPFLTDELDMELPDAFDLRQVGVVPPVRNQEATNTCWAFGSTAAVETSYLLNGRNLYDFNYSSAIRLDTELPVMEDGTVVYYFDKNDGDALDEAVFLAERLSWDDGPTEDEDGMLKWEFSGDLSAVDLSALDEETDGLRMTENGKEVLLFTPVKSGSITVKVSSAEDPTKTASCQVLLVEKNQVDSISLSPEVMILKPGEKGILKVSMEGPDVSEVIPVFSSDHPGIASVDDEGNVIGIRKGTTLIRVRAGGKEAVCRVIVRSFGGSSDGDSKNIEWTGSDSAVHGTWTLTENGMWTFSSGGAAYRNGWGYLYNPYANGGAGGAGWFCFDAQGNMRTGWYQAEDGYVYYLNPRSDGSLGQMLTGWQWIPDDSGQEHCYYFKPDAGGPMGAMAVSLTTPDGYQVNERGRWWEENVEQTRTD